MPAPTTLAEFLDLVRRSGVVDEARLNAYLDKVPGESPLPDDPAKAAGILVRDAILTHFQAEQFLLGKWRRFTIGKYRVLERLGSGGMGSVYLCEHIFMRRRVAVKVLPTSRSEDASAIERFYREARAVAALDHPNIVRAYDIDQDEGLHFLVMEHIDGASLQEIVKRHGPLSVERACHYIKQTALGLQHAHQAAGLIHRDIKPGNILLDRKGVVKILDLGLARFFHDEEAPITQKFDENVLGTADYLAPEQALDSHNVDVRADIYSLGATFYFCLTGNTPFEGTVAQKLIWHQTRQPKPVRTLRPDVPEEVSAIIERMMAKDPAQRFASPAEVMEALAPWTQNEIPPPPEEEMPRLSPAAMGLSSGDGAEGSYVPPASVPAPSSRRWTGAPLSGTRSGVNAPSGVGSRIGSAPAAPAAQVSPSSIVRRAATAVRQPDPSGLSWSIPRQSPAPETADVSGQADTASQSKRKPASQSGIRTVPAQTAPARTPVPAGKRQTFAGALRRPSPLAWCIAGGAVAGIILAAVLIKLTRTDAAVRAVPVHRLRAPTEWQVSRVSRPGSFKTVREALYEAKARDTITVTDDIEESLLLEDPRWGRNVTIQAAPGKLIRWSCPDHPKYGKFIVLNGVEGLRIKGFVFDGKHRVQDLVALGGRCPHLVMEDCQFEGANRICLAIWNCTADAGKAVTLTRLRFATTGETETGLSINSSPTEASPLSQGIMLTDSRFEGPFKQAVRVGSPVANLLLRGNRIFQARTGFFYQKNIPPNPLQASIESNTFAEIQGPALQLETLPPAGNSSLVDVTNNLFFHVGELIHLGEGADAESLRDVLRASGNARDPASGQGNLNLSAATVTFTLPMDPNDSAHFLRYPGTDPLAHAGVKGHPVGAPPAE